MKISLVIMFIYVLIFFHEKPVCAADSYGLFMVVKGQINILNPEKKTNLPAKVGSKVFPGETVVAGADSRAKIVMMDRNVINIAPDTEFVISKYSNSADNSGNGEKTAQLAVLQGKVRANVEQKYEKENQKFEIRTPTAVAGVRGTNFFVSYNKQTQQTQVFVASGKVNFAPLALNTSSTQKNNLSGDSKGKTQDLSSAPVDSSKQVSVGKDQTSSVSAGTLPTPPRVASADEMKNIKSGTQDNSKDSGNQKGGEGSSGKSGSGEKSDKADRGEKKEMITKEMVGSDAIKTDKQLGQEMNQPPPVPTQNMIPVKTAPNLPTQNPMTSEIIQNQNSKTNVIIQPQK